MSIPDDSSEVADSLIRRMQDDPFDPVYEAYKLRLTGLGWREIAEQTGYPNDAQCRVEVRRYLESAINTTLQENKQEALALEVARLDELQHAWWNAAMRLDDKAANIVLRTMAQRAKLKGLETDDPAGKNASKTILVMAKDYTKTLKQIASGELTIEEEEDD